jgi:hypothetical protein
MFFIFFKIVNYIFSLFLISIFYYDFNRISRNYAQFNDFSMISRLVETLLVVCSEFTVVVVKYADADAKYSLK